MIPNDRLLQLGDVGVSLMDAFRSADEVLLSGVQGITDLITTPGLINLDFADVKSVMSGAGSALMGIGSSRGEGRAVQAAGKAINSPLLEASMDGAQGVLLSIAGGSDLGLFEINEAASLVQEAAHPEANIIFGTVIDDSLGDEVRVTVIAAGFDGRRADAQEAGADGVRFGAAGGQRERRLGCAGAEGRQRVRQRPVERVRGQRAPAQPVPATAHQAGTLPPAAPSYSSRRTPRRRRDPGGGRREASGFGLPNDGRGRARAGQPAAATLPPAPPSAPPAPSGSSYSSFSSSLLPSASATANDPDDDVDVPSFMKR